MTTAAERKTRFANWLVDPHGGKVKPNTRNVDISAINTFQKEFLEGKDFYSLPIEEIYAAIKGNAAAVQAFVEKHAQFRAVMKKYREFLQGNPASAHFIVHKNPKNIDITQDVSVALLMHLFIKTHEKNFPGYTMYTKAQAKNCKEFSVLLENSAEKKVLFVVLLPRSTGEIPKLFQDITADFDTLRGLFEKEGSVFSVLVVARKFGRNFKSDVLTEIPNIKFMRYSLNALELQDAH